LACEALDIRVIWTQEQSEQPLMIEASIPLGKIAFASLERGKRADMVVLSHDPTAVDAAFIREIAVEQTYVEGQLLYQR
jgi:hypothetical protein